MFSSVPFSHKHTDTVDLCAYLVMLRWPQSIDMKLEKYKGKQKKQEKNYDKFKEVQCIHLHKPIFVWMNQEQWKKKWYETNIQNKDKDKDKDCHTIQNHNESEVCRRT